MDGLSVNVVCTYNASNTFQEQLSVDQLNPKEGMVTRKLLGYRPQKPIRTSAYVNPRDSPVEENSLAYNRDNRAVAIQSNHQHQRAAPKFHEKSTENLEATIKQNKAEMSEAKKEMKKGKKGTT